MNEAVSSVSTEDRLLVDDVVNVLTCPPAGEGSTRLSLKEQLQRAAEEYDRRMASTIGRALIDSLCDDPGDVRRLEALLILGLAHPAILDNYHVSLAAEGRRLCVLLDNQGEQDRARALLELLAAELPEDRQIQQDLAGFMRRAGDVDELIDRCLRRGEEEARAGNTTEAITWLQEVLLHDQSRRDVARMIRDLRYQHMTDQKTARRRNRVILLIVVLTTSLTAMVLRENKIAQEYAALPPFSQDDQESLDSRMRGIDGMIASNRVWFGMFSAANERSDLSRRKDELGFEQAKSRRIEAGLLYERMARAESLRLKAIDAVAAGDLNSAKEQFQQSLEGAPADWPRRERIEANIVAIEKLLEERK